MALKWKLSESHLALQDTVFSSWIIIEYILVPFPSHCREFTNHMHEITPSVFFQCSRTTSGNSGCINQASNILRDCLFASKNFSSSTDTRTVWWSLLIRAKCLTCTFWNMLNHKPFPKAQSSLSKMSLAQFLLLAQVNWGLEKPRSFKQQALIISRNFANKFLLIFTPPNLSAAARTWFQSAKSNQGS